MALPTKESTNLLLVMKTLCTRLLLPAVALLGLSSCVDPYMTYGPGYVSSGGYRGYGSAPLAYRSSYYSPNRYYGSRSYPSGRSYYGTPYRSSYYGYSSVYQPVGFPGFGLFGGAPFYGNSYYGGSRSPYYRSSSRSRGGYYPNDPDDRNNPRHPNYIGPQVSGSRGYFNRGNNYYANDPDDRNNPRHPNYIGPQGSRTFNSRSFNPGHNYYANDPDDRNNPSHPHYIGPPLH